MQGLLAVVREPFETNAIAVRVTAEVLVNLVRRDAIAIGLPLLWMLLAFAVGTIGAHQAQVRGLWTPSRLIPDLSRLWAFSGGGDTSSRFERSLWGIIKAVVLVAVAIWSIEATWNGIRRTAELDAGPLSQAAAEIVLSQARWLAFVLLVMGGLDYALRLRRFESMLRTTPQQQREDQRTMEGDLALRSQRRQAARSMRVDSPSWLVGASLALLGDDGLTLVLEGGPPPIAIRVRIALSGERGTRLRRTVESARTPCVESPDLAKRLACGGRSSPNAPVFPEIAAELARLWPASPHRNGRDHTNQPALDQA
jgi:flagellar biosynthetic protein FlhB